MELTLAEIKRSPSYHLFETMEGIRYVVKDHQNRYMYVNQTWLDSLGIQSIDLVIGKTASDIFPKWRAERYLQEERRVIEERLVYDYEEFLLNSEGVIEKWRTRKSPWIIDDQVVGYVNLGTRLDDKKLERRKDMIPVIVQEIAQNACNSMSLDEIAKKIGISKRTLERRFKNFMDETPQAFRSQCRLLRAKRLLRDGKKAVEVSEICGFSDQSHFSKTFVKSTKLTPRQYQLEQLKHA